MNYKHKKSLYEETSVKGMKRYKSFLFWLNWHHQDYYIRETQNMIDIIYEKSQVLFFKDSDNMQKMSKGLFLFNLVKKDAEKFIKTKQIPKIKKYPSANNNENFKKINSRMTGTDLNHAYWRIAYNLGIITENTYNYGTKSKDYKSTRLMALSTLGREKIWEFKSVDIKSKKVKKLLGNENLRNLYEAIRLKCYWHMEQMRKLLGDDFICYKTDCIYYTDTKANRKKIQAYCDKYQLLYKQLSGDKKIRPLQRGR